MRLQSAIFDMDGTLLDSMPAWETLAERLLAEEGFSIDPVLRARVKSMTMPQAAQAMKAAYPLAATAEELVARAGDHMGRFYRQQVTAKPGVDKLLSLLKMEGVWMYVATATNRPLAEAALRRAGLWDYFRGMLTCGEVGVGKESPLIYEKCLTRLRCRKEDCVVFEDALYAIRTAKAAGFRIAGVYDASAEAEQGEIQALSELYIRDYSEFLEVSLRQ